MFLNGYDLTLLVYPKKWWVHSKMAMFSKTRVWTWQSGNHNNVIIWEATAKKLEKEIVESDQLSNLRDVSKSKFKADWCFGTWLLYVSINIGNVIIPTGEIIFFRGVGSTTKQQRDILLRKETDGLSNISRWLSHSIPARSMAISDTQTGGTVSLKQNIVLGVYPLT